MLSDELGFYSVYFFSTFRLKDYLLPYSEISLLFFGEILCD